MGFFSFIQEIAMDLGTANTIITSDGKIVVDEPSVVALDRRTDKMIAVGEKAKLMYEKTHDNIRTVRPLREGVIADFYACEQLMRGLIKMVHTGSRLFSPSLRMVIGVPSGSTEVELRAVRDSAEHAGGRDVYLIYEPMAAAIGIGIDVEAPQGNMIVDIGGGSTEIAVISLGGIVSNNSIRIAGDDLTADIQEYMSRQHNVKGERAHGRTYQDSRGSSVDGIGRGRSGGLYRVRTEPYYGPADGGPGVLSGGGALHGEEYRPYRDGCLERVGEYAAGIVCRHRAQRYLPDGWRSFVAWFGQTVDRQDQHSVPHRRRSATQCGQRHRYSIEEREQLFFFDVTRAGLIRFSEEI